MKSDKLSFYSRLLTSSLVLSLCAGSVYSAEMRPLPPVIVPPVTAALPAALESPGLPTVLPPEALTRGVPASSSVVTPASQVPVLSAPTAIPLPAQENPSTMASIPPAAASGIPSSTPQNLPNLPSVAPLAQAPEETIQPLSQPLRPVSPGLIAEVDKKVEDEGNYFNVNEDIGEVTKQISRALGKNFLLDDKLKGKVTIISERKMTKDEIWEAYLSALDSLGMTIVQGPAGLLKIVPTREAISNPIDFYTDSTPYTDRFITRLINMKNINASDMANVVKGLVSKEGNLFAYPATNSLIITDSGTNIDRLIRLINELDQEGPQEVLEIIPIIYADVKDLSAKITQIFETDKSSSPSGGAGTAPVRKSGKEPESLDEIPKLKKVIPDDRTNSLIVLASKRSIEKVRDLIRKLDSPVQGDTGEVHVYYLKYAAAKDMSTVLTAISGAVQQGKDKKSGNAAGTPPDAAKAAVSSLVGGAEFTGKFTVTADENTNSLVITANAKDYSTLIDQVIAKLDIPRNQVYVESVIVELSVSEGQNLGAGLLGGKSINVGGSDLNLFGSTFGFLPGGVSSLLNGSVGGASSNTIGINAPGVSSGSGSSSTTTVPGFFAALQFAQSNSDVNILSTPNILTLDNQEAEIKVGQKVPFPSASATTIGGSLQTTFTREDVALSLKIKPQISEGGNIRMEVTQEDRNVLPADQQSANAANAGPSTTERSIKTHIVASNGQTVVLGGLIKDKYQNVVHKIPILGDVPLLGYLFKTKTKSKEKVNLVVFLTPHIIREPKDFLSILRKKIDEQNAFVEQNFNSTQKKQYKNSIETHAAHLLKVSEANEPVETPSNSLGKPAGEISSIEKTNEKPLVEVRSSKKSEPALEEVDDLATSSDPVYRKKKR
ncbi:MAG: type II secretion system secretin GspD [Deltaproteobacteria bacterium]|nr:MAG: type II secretion system secretin GspD [Deltaproteobacteria bacterium]